MSRARHDQQLLAARCAVRIVFVPHVAGDEAVVLAVEEEDGRWHLTPKGFLVSNQIIGGLLDAQAAEKQRRADAAARGDFRVNLD